MPSPFPGMDPYLEGDLWPEFHQPPPPPPFGAEDAAWLQERLQAAGWR